MAISVSCLKWRDDATKIYDLYSRPCQVLQLVSGKKQQLEWLGMQYLTTCPFRQKMIEIIC